MGMLWHVWLHTVSIGLGKISTWAKIFSSRDHFFGVDQNKRFRERFDTVIQIIF